MSTMETIVALWRWLCGWGVSVVVVGFLIHEGYYRIGQDKKTTVIYIVLIIVAIVASLFLNGIFL